MSESAAYLDFVRAAREGERRGVALFSGLARHRTDAREVELLGRLTRLEEVTGALLDDLLERIDPSWSDGSAAVTDPRVDELASSSWPALMDWLRGLVEPLIPRFEAAEALAPREDRWVLKVFTAHEVALFDFAVAQIADPTTAAGIGAVDAVVDRIVAAG